MFTHMYLHVFPMVQIVSGVLSCIAILVISSTLWIYKTQMWTMNLDSANQVSGVTIDETEFLLRVFMIIFWQNWQNIDALRFVMYFSNNFTLYTANSCVYIVYLCSVFYWMSACYSCHWQIPSHTVIRGNGNSKCKYSN